MRKLLLVALAGCVAQLIDGSLGMAYGVTSTTLLLVVGMSPVLASASVHLAEIGTILISGLSHAKFGNVDWHVARRIALPGAVGALSGALLLGRLPVHLAKIWVSAFLFCLGCYLILRFLLGRGIPHGADPSTRTLVVTGGVAGFLDAMGGGGWGPVATPTLMVATRMQPSKVVGTVDTSEFLVSCAASLGFLLTINSGGIAFPIVACLLLGGAIAAPVAAWLVRHMHPSLLGVAVGGLILLSNAHTMLETFRLPGVAALTAYLLVGGLWLVALAVASGAVLVERFYSSLQRGLEI